MYLKTIVLALATLAIPYTTFAANELQPISAVEIITLGGRKTVTVSANSIGEALAKAEQQNSGWTAISAKKTGGGKFYQVTMKK